MTQLLLFYRMKKLINFVNVDKLEIEIMTEKKNAPHDTNERELLKRADRGANNGTKKISNGEKNETETERSPKSLIFFS